MGCYRCRFEGLLYGLQKVEEVLKLTFLKEVFKHENKLETIDKTILVSMLYKGLKYRHKSFSAVEVFSRLKE